MSDEELDLEMGVLFIVTFHVPSMDTGLHLRKCLAPPFFSKIQFWEMK